jgi:hypothetical protein
MCVFIHAGNTYVIAPLEEINSGGDKRRRVVIELFTEKELGERDSNITTPPLFTAENIQRYYDDIYMGLLPCHYPLHPFPPFAQVPC